MLLFIWWVDREIVKNECANVCAAESVRTNLQLIEWQQQQRAWSQLRERWKEQSTEIALMKPWSIPVTGPKAQRSTGAWEDVHSGIAGSAAVAAKDGNTWVNVMVQFLLFNELTCICHYDVMSIEEKIELKRLNTMWKTQSQSEGVWILYECNVPQLANTFCLDLHTLLSAP